MTNLAENLKKGFVIFLLVYFAGSMLSYGVVKLLGISKVSSWPQAEAHVVQYETFTLPNQEAVSSGEYGRGGNRGSNRPTEQSIIVYAFEAKNIVYRGLANDPIGIWGATQYWRNTQVGAKLKIYYNPQDPSQSMFVDTGMLIYYYTYSILTLIISFVAFVFAWKYYRQLRKSIRASANLI